MLYNLKYILYFLPLLFLGNCTGSPSADPINETRVAFLSDVHFHDIFTPSVGDLPVGSVPTLSDGTPVLARTMRAQIGSTRLFNENYFAFIATLDDIADRGIRYVVLNGDFTDDGQPINVDGITAILRRYEEDHGIRFFMSYGNHDPYLPFTVPAGKSDFLLYNGVSGGVFSPGHPRCDNGSALCLDGLKELGYEDLLNKTSDYGFIPRPDDLHFETPFSAARDGDATLAQNRTFEICTEDGSWCGFSFDTSYLIEPGPGIWLLSIDANVHIPRDVREDDNPSNPRNYLSSGNAGFDAVVKHKPFLLDWMRDVANRADTLNKQLFVFSHYPAGDFYHGTRNLLSGLFGETGLQLRRLPSLQTQQQIAETGIPFHVGGHMHINNTHVLRSRDGNMVTWGIQSPSLAAFLPGYTIINYTSEGSIDVETVVLDDVAGFRTLFELYRAEWEQSEHPRWDIGILDAETYLDYTVEHLRQLTVHRFVPSDWPEPLRNRLNTHSLGELLAEIDIPLPESCSYEQPLMQLVHHFYMYRNGGSFAEMYIGEKQRRCYTRLGEFHYERLHSLDDVDRAQTMADQFALFSVILYKFSQPMPDATFRIQNGDIQTVQTP